MPEKTIEGSCLCGRVRYEAMGPFPRFAYCHCERCQKSLGTAHSASLLVLKDNLKWVAGGDETTLFVHKEAEGYMRNFCRTCGSPVPKPTRDGKYLVVPAGTLDEDPGVRPQDNIFCRLAASWYVPPESLPKFDERP